MENYPKPVTKDTHKKIMEHLDNSIYKIKGKDNKYCIGIFCNIKFHNKNIPVLITNYKFINEKYYSNDQNIEVFINNELILIEFSSIYYMDKDLDISIIEIKENKLINILDIDENIYKDESEICLNKETIYIIHNTNNNICVSYGIIKDINKKELFIHCNINSDSNCYPIFNLKTNKLIGIYTKNFNFYKKGIYLHYIIKKLKYNFQYLKKDQKNNDYFNNEINIVININKEDIGHNIYFLDNEYEENYIFYSFHDNLKELNELNAELYINKKKEKYKKYFVPDNNIIYNINLKFNINLTDCSYMFAGCKNIINIDFISFNTKYINNMKFMFYGCKNLKDVNLLSFNTSNIIDMSHMFEFCENLKYLDLSSFIINNEVNFKDMFFGSYIFKNIENIINLEFKELKELYLSKNQISDIQVLERVNYKELQNLNLNANEISDIGVLEKVNFKQLKSLSLYHNQISDIKVLEHVYFKVLKELDLSNNKISDIKVLEKANFKELQKLNLSWNEISEIKVLEKVDFNQLQNLYLSNNKISDIKVLEKVNFKELKVLYLGYNQISEIIVLEKVNFKELKELALNDNKISDIKVLEKVNFKELSKLYLSNNKISDIKVLKKVNFKILKELYLINNKIDNKINSTIIEYLQSKISIFRY